MPSTLDTALQRSNGYGPEFGGELTNHAPMVLEAMDHLGVIDHADSWLDRYSPGLMPWPPVSPTGAVAGRPELLGQYDRLSAWRLHFERELLLRPSPAVLGEWVPRLAPGVSAAAGHGLIRVGHAARGFERAPSEARRQELAAALAYWAARFGVLPRDSPKKPGLAPAEALHLLQPDRRPSRAGMITERLAKLGDHPDLLAAPDALDVTSPDRTVSQIAQVFARVVLAHADTRLHAVVFTHTVTMPGAARMLMTYLDDEEKRQLVRFVWQTCVAMFLGYGQFAPSDRSETLGPPDGDTLVRRALACGDEHAIKLVDACLTEETHSNGPIFRAAADAAITVLS